MKCKHCGFDSMEESIRMVGAPCGFNDCTVFLCCIEAYHEHVKSYHAGEVDQDELRFEAFQSLETTTKNASEEIREGGG